MFSPEQNMKKTVSLPEKHENGGMIILFPSQHIIFSGCNSPEPGI